MTRPEKIYSFFFAFLCAALVLLSFRLQWVGDYLGEDGFFEWVSAVFEFLGAYFCFKILFSQRSTGLQRPPYFLALCGLLFFVVGGEEISWGQRIFSLGFAGLEGNNYQREFNLHNIASLNSLLSIGDLIFIVIVAGFLPLLSFYSRRVKTLLPKLGVPLMPRSVCLGIWMALIFMVLARHFVWSAPGAFVFRRDVDVFLQEYREFYFPLVLSMWVMAESFTLDKYGRFYDFVRPSGEQAGQKGFFREAAKDLSTLVFRNKPLIIIILAVIFIVLPFANERNTELVERDHQLLLNNSSLIAFQGERSVKTNTKAHWVASHAGFFEGRCLFLSSADLPREGYFSFSYSFQIDAPGSYRIFAAGSPPGPLRGVGDLGDPGSAPPTYSPYDVSVDGGPEIAIYQQKKDRELFQKMGAYFYSYYVYAEGMTFTRLGEFELEAGPHVIEFRVSEIQPNDATYVFGLDAVFVVPQNWKLEGKLKMLPDDIFSY